MIRMAICHDPGHPWKDGHTVGDEVLVYARELPAPMAPGQYTRVGTQPWPWTVTTRCHTLRPLRLAEWPRAIVLAAGDFFVRIGAHVLRILG